MFNVTVLILYFIMPLLALAQQDRGSVPSRQQDVTTRLDNSKTGRGFDQDIMPASKGEKQPGGMRETLRRAKRLYELGKYVKAEKMFMEVLEAAQKSNNLKAQVLALEGLGLAYSAFHRLPESIETLRQAFLINNTLNNRQGTIRIAKILSDVYYSKGRYDSALHFANVSMQEATRLQMNSEIDIARLSKIAALIRLKKWEECDREITPLISKAASKSNSTFFVQFHSMMGNYYLAKGQQSTSQQHYEKALHEAIALNRPELLTVVYGNMIDSYYDKGDFKKGLDCLQKYKELRNIQQSGENTETVFHTDLYKNEIYNFNIENKLKDLRLRQEAEESKMKDLIMIKGDEERSSLRRKNFEKDSLLVFKDSLLKTQQLLYDARVRESTSERIAQEQKAELTNYKLKKADQLTKNLLAGLGIVLLLGSIIFYQYQKQRKKNAIIEMQKVELQVLMREIHHRVKNNLQVISSLLDLQSQSIQDRQASDAIKEGKNRVQSMALIHQNLYGE